jgi:hypothetical protein
MLLSLMGIGLDTLTIALSTLFIIMIGVAVFFGCRSLFRKLFHTLTQQAINRGSVLSAIILAPAFFVVGVAAIAYFLMEREPVMSEEEAELNYQFIEDGFARDLAVGMSKAEVYEIAPVYDTTGTVWQAELTLPGASKMFRYEFTFEEGKLAKHGRTELLQPINKPYNLSMKNVIWVLLFSTLSGYCFAQKLVVMNEKTKRTRKIKIGKVMSVVTKEDTVADPYNYYVDSAKTTGYYCPDGCSRLVDVNVSSSTFSLKRGSEVIHYLLSEVEYINYVRARKPHRVFALRVAAATLGFVIIVGRTISIGSEESAQQKATDYLAGATALGVAVLVRSNIPRRYKLIGVEN